MSRLALERAAAERPVEVLEGPPRVEGPLGLWPWPILNAVLAFLYALRALRARAAARPRRRLVTYEIVRDERGRIVEIVEHSVEG